MGRNTGCSSSSLLECRSATHICIVHCKEVTRGAWGVVDVVRQPLKFSTVSLSVSSSSSSSSSPSPTTVEEGREAPERCLSKTAILSSDVLRFHGLSHQASLNLSRWVW